MRGLISTLSLATLLAAPLASAQEPPSAATPAGDAAKGEAQKAPKLRLIVLDLKGGGLEPAQLEALTGYVTVTLSEYAPLEVLSGADVRAMVELEGEKQSLGCADDTSCLAEVAGAMGARLVVFGQMAKLGSRYVLNLSLFDSEAGKAVGRASVTGDALEEVFEQMPRGVHKLVGAFLERQGYSVEAPVAAAPARAAAAEPAAPPSEGTPFAIVLPVSALLLAGGLVGGGAAIDAFSPTSHDKVLGFVDFIPASMYVAAAGAAVAGVVLFFANPLEGD